MALDDHKPAMTVPASPSTLAVPPTTIRESCVRGHESIPYVDSDEPHTKQSPADAEKHTALQGLAAMSSFAPRAAPNSSKTDEFFCQDCRRPLEPGTTGVRVRSKAKKIYQCGNCNSKGTVLSYALGGWPTDEFRSWDEDTKVQFYRNLHGKSYDILKYYARTLAQIQLKRKIDRYPRELRPSHYWFSSG